MKRWYVALCLVFAAACQKSVVKVLIGGTAVVTEGAQPIQDAVIIVAGKSVRFVGMRKDAAIPQDSERVDLSGKWITPAPGARIAEGEEADLLVHEASADGAVTRRLVAGEWQQ